MPFLCQVLMTPFSTTEEFEQELQNCLLHFYDFAYLQDNPVVKSLVPDVTTANRIQQFRERITDAVEHLRPPEHVPALAKGARAYNVLTMRYIEQADVDEITEQLAISRRQFYRELSRAITSLANILRDASSTDDEPTDDVFTLQSEIASLRQHTSRQVTVNLSDLLHGAIKANTILATNHGVTIQYPSFDDHMNVSLDRALVRQLIVILLSTIVGQYQSDRTLTIDNRVSEDDISIIFRLDDKETVRTILDVLRQQSSITTLVATVAGSLHLSPNDEHSILLTIPLRRTTMLIIDDNPDVINLFRRLLDSSIYRLIIAPDGTDILDMIKRLSVDIIVLDIMLPRIDGFEILQTLKSNATTKDLPIIICSVLDTEELALSLGADAVISKPPTKSELNDILQKVSEKAPAINTGDESESR